jgi:surface protein
MLFLVGISGVSAATKDLEIADFELQSKSSTATIDSVTLDGDKVTSNIVFNKVDDFASFNLTIKNNSSDKYKVISVEDNNENKNISITYDYDKDYFEKDKTTSIKIKIKYEKELTNKEKLSLNNLNIKVNFEKEDGSKSSIVINPTTGDSIIRFIILGIISLAGLALIIAKKKIRIGAILLVLVGIMIPFAALANEKYEINLKFTNIDIIGTKVTPTPDPIPDEPVVISEHTTFVDGETVNAIISTGTGTFRKATEEEYNAAKASLTSNNIVSKNSDESPIYLWNNNGDVLYYSLSPTIYLNEDSSYMFSNSQLTSIDLSGVDTSEVVDMGSMFKGTSSLTNLSLTGIDTSSVTNMSSMFEGTGLTTLSLDSFNTTKVTDMSSMFKGSSNLTSLDISDFDTKKVTNMNSMFANCSNLATITVSDSLWDTSKVTNGIDMFAGDTSLLGVEGTTYDSNNDDLDYAYIDYGTLDPGYLSEENHVVDTEATLAVGRSVWERTLDIVSTSIYGEFGSDGYYDPENFTEEDLECSDEYDPDYGYYCFNAYGSLYANGSENVKNFRKATREEYRKVKRSLTRENMISKTTSIPVYEWVDEDTNDLVYYSRAKTIYLNEDSYEMFYETYFESIDLSGMDSSRVETMEGMFSRGYNLKSINLSGFDTSNVTTMRRMFAECEYLETLDLKSFSLESAEDLSEMFEDDENLTTIYVSDSWDPNNDYENDTPGISSYEMFYDCYSLVGQDGTEYDSSYDDALYAVIDGKDGRPGYLSSTAAFSSPAKFISGEYIHYMFYNMDTSGKSFRKATEEEYNSAKDTLTKADNLVSVKPVPAIYMWETNDNVLYYSTSSDIYLNEDASYMFSGTGFVSIDLSGIKTSETTDMSDMFNDCSELTEIIFEDPSLVVLSNTNNNSLSANVMDVNNGIGPMLFAIIMVGITFGVLAFVFKGFELRKPSLTVGFVVGTVVVVSLSILLWNFNIGKVFAIDNNEQNNNQVTHTFDTSNVTDMSYMFYNCTSLTEIDLSIFDTSNVTDMSFMFYNSTSLTEIDLSSFDTSNVTTMDSMFDGCESLIEIDLSSFNIDKVEEMTDMFYNCHALETIYVSDQWYVEVIDVGSEPGSLISSSSMFYNCDSLVGGKGTAYDSIKTNGAYANVDGGHASPGYLTLKGTEKVVETYAVLSRENLFYKFSEEIAEDSWESCVFCEVGEHDWEIFRKATEEEYNAVKDTLVDDNRIDDEYESPNPIYLWYDDGAMLYYSEVDVILMQELVLDMFSNTSFEVIDLSEIHAETSYSADEMFKNCTNLTTIYAPHGWQGEDGLHPAHTIDMFEGDTQLIGGAGTTYDGDHTDGTYAHIDGGVENPGYFTLKE